MKKEELFTDAFLKQFKTDDELSSFLKQSQKLGVKNMSSESKTQIYAAQ